MSVLVLVEHDGSTIKDATLATVTAAAKLGEVHALVAGSDRCLHDPYTLCGRCSRLYTGSRILFIEQTNRVGTPDACTVSVNEQGGIPSRW